MTARSEPYNRGAIHAKPFGFETHAMRTQNVNGAIAEADVAAQHSGAATSFGREAESLCGGRASKIGHNPNRVSRFAAKHFLMLPFALFVERSDTQSFIDRWHNSGAAERANYQLFLSELCDLIVSLADRLHELSDTEGHAFEKPQQNLK